VRYGKWGGFGPWKLLADSECSAWRVEALVHVNGPRGCGLCLMPDDFRGTCAHGCYGYFMAVGEVTDL